MARRGGRRALVAALAVLAAAAAPAAAGVRQAEDVLPPGQSGFVPITGLTSGTGSPHLTDQVGLFTSFRYKPHTFNQPGEEERPRDGVRIVRDAYGVPAVTGDTDSDAWWGVGYAVAQDRLFELEAFRRATSGRLAELVGKSALGDDLVARRDYYTAAEIDAMIEDAKRRRPDLYQRSVAYRNGMNAWINTVRLDPSKMPGELVALGVALQDFTLRDMFRIGVFLARTVPSGDGPELDNARALLGAGPRNFFKLHKIRTSGQIPTVPAEEGTFPAQPGRTRREEVRAFSRSYEWLLQVRDRLPPAPAEPPAIRKSRAARDFFTVRTKRGTVRMPRLQALTGKRRGSFMWAVRNPATREAFLFNGPQLGYSIPELFVEFEINSPSTNARGVSAPGIPLMAIGHNGRVAWGFTSGLSDEDDLYVEELTGGETYRYKGEQRQMECRDEVFRYRTPVTDVLDDPTAIADPAGSRRERICRTVHGPVQERGDGVALARRYAIWKRELETLDGLADVTDSRSVHDVQAALSKVTWNENLIAADDQGNIGYWHPGLHPRRPDGWDERLPYPGTGEAEWSGLLAFSQTPQVINPRQNWLANWNNPPSAGWTNGDGNASERLSGPLHRVGWLMRLVRRLAREPTYQRHIAVIRLSGTHAQQRVLAGRRLREAARRASGRAAEVLDAILRWGGSYDTTDAAGTVDPGVAIWEEFKDQAEELLLSTMAPEARYLAGETGSSHEFDISNGEAQALLRLGPAGYERAAERTAAALAERFGTAEIARWREPRRMYDVEALGAASAPALPFFDRGTWEQSVHLGP